MPDERRDHRALHSRVRDSDAAAFEESWDVPTHGAVDSVIDGQPVRGSIPSPWFSALPEIDRARAFSQGLLLAPPLAAFRGYRE